MAVKAKQETPKIGTPEIKPQTEKPIIAKKMRQVMMKVIILIVI